MNTLVQIYYSPWSERARWALEFHGVPFRTAEHTPLVGEAFLRLKARRFTGKVSVPMLLSDDGTAVTDSLRIAQHAERISTRSDGARLFPTEKTAEITRWVELAESMCDAGRARVVREMVGDPEMLAEALPAFVPATARRALHPVARLGATFVRFKYGVDRTDGADNERVLREGLTQCAAALDGRDFLLGTFSYADIAIATALQSVRPVADAHLRLGPATRARWTHAPLAEAFEPVLAWRDKLYATQRLA